MSFNLAAHQPMEHVLVIDDDVGLCELVGEYLQPEGYTVEAIHNGERGIDRALSNEHDLVVLDVMLPDLNGFEICRRLKAQSSTRDIPVIFMTAKAMPQEVARFRSLGAAAVIAKPFDPMLLGEHVFAVWEQL